MITVDTDAVKTVHSSRSRTRERHTAESSKKTHKGVLPPLCSPTMFSHSRKNLKTANSLYCNGPWREESAPRTRSDYGRPGVQARGVCLCVQWPHAEIEGNLAAYNMSKEAYFLPKRPRPLRPRVDSAGSCCAAIAGRG